MEKIIPYFGAIDLALPNEYNEAIYSVDGREIDLSLAFFNAFEGEDGITEFSAVKDLDPAVLDRVARFMEELDSKIALARAACIADFHANGEVRDTYIDHHLSELSPEELAALIDGTDASLPVEERMLATLHLCHIGLHPMPDESDGSFAMFDFTFGEDLTNYVVAVKFAEDGTIQSVDVES
ncbi:DUF2004 domain-containing protein [Massilia pseudoviolaceinigra]|uniref:DUF2004 domain-containing protein n=1 Tax=Massilia pseudoviolaceinigra TaxID=3057165 RepID=UPI002796D029|nr:DUF2004 domain-containing protein [Massilia sp. CCM 9206]MDQ1924482.1 DUF2004 domain-containing protein [Massilia sp. CCM 9206]